MTKNTYSLNGSLVQMASKNFGAKENINVQKCGFLTFFPQSPIKISKVNCTKVKICLANELHTSSIKLNYRLRTAQVYC